MTCRTVDTDARITAVLPVSIPVGSAVGQSLVLGAEYTVIVFVIHIFPPFVAAFHGLRPLVGGGQHTSVFKYLFADIRSFVGGIGNNRLYFREVRCHTVIHFIKRHAVMYISRGKSNATLSCTFPGVTTASRTKPCLSQAVWAS